MIRGSQKVQNPFIFSQNPFKKGLLAIGLLAIMIS